KLRINPQYRCQRELVRPSRSEEFVASLQRSLSESQRWLDALERIVDIRLLRGFGYSKCNRKCRRHVRMMIVHILISTVAPWRDCVSCSLLAISRAAESSVLTALSENRALAQIA